MQLSQAKAVRSVYYDGIGGRNIEAAFYDRGADQDVESLAVKIQHDRFQFALRHLAVCDCQAGIRRQFLYLAGNPFDRADLVVQEKYLSAALYLPLQGLAQLHQLRGRVGRSHHRAYAYLIVPDKRSMTADARKRLEAIASLEELGAGFTLATHDLEIRGAGELLGSEQSGQINQVGFSLYSDMLARAVEALRKGEDPDLDQPVQRGIDIELHIPALIPDTYLGDVQSRLTLYKRIASARDTAALRELQVEMIDRFGLLPDPIKNLFEIAGLRHIAERVGITRLDFGPQGGRMEFAEDTRARPEALIQLIQEQSLDYRMDGPQKLRILLQEESENKRLLAATQLLTRLAPIHTVANNGK